jgi:hypothetical protein
MPQSATKPNQLMVSPAVVRLVKEASHEEQLAALRGEAALSLKDLLTVYLFLFQSADRMTREAVIEALSATDSGELADLIAAEGELHPKHLELIARVRLEDVRVIGALLKSPDITGPTLINIATHCRGPVFALFASKQRLLESAPELREALIANPRVDAETKTQLGLVVPIPESEADSPADDGDEVADAGAVAEDDPVNLSKYQQSLEMPVAEKIKMGLTGDKEWRSILIKEANKLVSAAVLKNPRITDGEVLAIAKNKSSSEELIRLITLNNEWLKNYEIKRALVMHNRTPLPKALRFMSILSEKDIKTLAKSRDVSSVLVNNARRILLAKEQKGK